MAKTALSLLSSFVLVCAVAFNAGAQQPQQPAETASNKAARPLWSELSPKQQAILAPIAGEWDSLDTTRRKKWVTIANRYPKMSSEEQQRLQSRMQDWVSLTPAQRRVARENYQTLKQLPQPQRGEVRQKWRQQQQSGAESGATPNTDAQSK